MAAPPSSTPTYRAFLGDVELTGVAFSDAQTLTGTVPAGVAVGTYAVTVENALGQRGSKDAAFQVQESGACSAAAITLLTAAVAAPNGVTVGQRVTVTATVRNSGSAGASIEGVITPPPNVFTPVSSDAGPKTAAAGASVTFTWVYTAAAVTPAEVTFAVDATGQDSAGSPVRAERVVTNAVLVSAAANLSLSAEASRARANVDQDIDYTLTVTNNGGSDARVVPAADTSVTGAAAVTVVSAPVAGETLVPAGQAGTFTWRFRVNAPTVLAIAGRLATAIDQNTNQPLTVSPAAAVQVTVVRPTALTAAVAASPARVDAGAPVAVVVTVQNLAGAADALAVAPVVNAPAGFALASGPTSPSQVIAGGATGTFGYTYTAGGGGGQFSVTATGTDANTGGQVSSSATSNQVRVRFLLSGGVTGLTADDGALRLDVAGTADDVTAAVTRASPSFAFRVDAGVAYSVSVSAQPTGQACSVTGGSAGNGSGTMPASDVPLAVSCVARTFTLAVATAPAGVGPVLCNDAPCASSYPFGTVLTLTAPPGRGFHLQRVERRLLWQWGLPAHDDREPERRGELPGRRCSRLA